jgi:holo-[acyl-carrier protein] synthase
MIADRSDLEPREMKMIAGIGVDVVEISRVRGVLERQGERFIRRVFTQAEQDYCRSHRDPAPHYAVRFAAKEAVFKALGTGWAGGVSWLQVEIRRTNPGAPALAIDGEALNRCAALGVRKAHVSLSHSDETAVAMVVLES